jgi:hypothetical protein
MDIDDNVGNGLKTQRVLSRNPELERFSRRGVGPCDVFSVGNVLKYHG